MKITKVSLIVYLLVLVNSFAAAQVFIEDYPPRYFPDVVPTNGSLLSRNDAGDIVVSDNNTGLKIWDDGTWKPVLPVFPYKNVLINYIKVISPQNIWVFFRRDQASYYTECAHLADGSWEYIDMPQPYALHRFDFIDSTKFFAGGTWGSLVYYNGQKAEAMQAQPLEDTNQIYAFSENHFYIIQRITDGERNYRYQLLEYKDDKLTIAKSLDWGSAIAVFHTPDSGYVMRSDGKLYDFRKGEFFFKNNLHLKSGTYSRINDDFYYPSDSGIVRFSYPESEVVISGGPNVDKFVMIDSSSLFLIYNNRLCYFGPEDYGQKMSLRTVFAHKYIYYYENSGDHGVSVFEDDKGDKAIFAISPNSDNSFFAYDSGRLVDVKSRYNLYGSDGDFGVSWDASIVFCDLDNDGDQDGLMAFLRNKSRLFENTSDWFVDVTDICNFEVSGRFYGFQVADLNQDGWLDFCAGNMMGGLYFVINKRHWRFDVLRSLPGIDEELPNGYMPYLHDTDNDGDQDLFLINIHKPVKYFKNSGLGSSSGLPRFVDVSNLSPDLTTRYDHFPQSLSFSDFDNDGDFDLLMINRVSRSLFLENDGQGNFSDITTETNFDLKALAYGSCWGDFDQDGFRDIYVTTLGRNYFFWNDSGKAFIKDSLSIPANSDDYSTGAIAFDLEDDGDLDIAVANNEKGATHILENITESRNQIRVELACIKNNYQGIGSSFFLYGKGHAGDENHLVSSAQMQPGTGYSSWGEAAVYFTGRENRSYDLKILFPDGTEKVVSVKSGNSYTFKDHAGLPAKANHYTKLSAGLFLHPRHQKLTISCSIFMLLLVISNIVLRRITLVNTAHALFYNFTMISGFAILLSSFFYLFEDPKPLSTLYLSALLALSLIYVLFRYTHSQYYEEKIYELFDLLRQFKHSNVGMNAIDHLLFQANNGSVKRYQSELNYFRSNTLPMLFRIDSLFKKLFQLRSTKRNMKGHLKKLLRKTSGHHARADVVALLNNLKQDVFALDKEVSILFRCSLLHALNQALSQKHGFSRVTTENEVGTDIIWVQFRHGDLVQVFDNLLTNAAEAVQNATEKYVNIDIYKSMGRIFIRIADSGGGVREADMMKIFSPGFTTKNSSGLGLHHARQLCAKYGGELEYLPNEKSSGAAFRISLKILEQAANANDSDD